jgi:acyl-CoA synthetase (AMP-forming)/AMP-acid ligase II
MDPADAEMLAPGITPVGGMRPDPVGLTGGAGSAMLLAQVRAVGRERASTGTPEGLGEHGLGENGLRAGRTESPVASVSNARPMPPEQLHAMAVDFGDETAYTVVGVGALTFRQWDGLASRLARGLVSAGVGPDDRVTIHLEPANALQWVVAYAAVHRAGAVAVPLNPQLTRPELERMLAHSDAAASITEESLLPRYPNDRPRVVVVVPSDGSGDGAGAGSGNSTGTGNSDRARSDGVAWADFLSDDATYLQVQRDPGDLADIMYTSGTTGSPKAVAVRHDNYSLIPFTRPEWSGGSWLHASPPYTFAGLAFVYTPMKLGLRAIYQPRFDAERWFDVVESEHPGSVFLVPAMAALLLEHPRFATTDLSSVQLCSIGSAPLAPFVLERLQERMPSALVSNNYGMTEAGSVYCMMPPGEAVKRPGSVGKPLPPAEVVCVDSEDGPVPAGQIGQVRLRIPGRPREYFGDPDATARTWVDGWLVTGDLGRIDEDGYLYIVGRSKDVVIRGGNNIHPTDVEYAIESHPAVREAAVVGVPHPVLGEDVVAFVTLRPGMEATPEDLRTHTLEQLAKYKVPRQWYIVDGLPRNATGKVLKQELRRRLDDGSPPTVGADTA